MNGLLLAFNNSSENMQRSSFSACRATNPSGYRICAMLKFCQDQDHPLTQRFFSFIQARDFPCVGAKSALGKAQVRAVVGRDVRSSWDDLRIYPQLKAIAQDYARDPVPFQSLVVVFEHDADLTEEQFEDHLWQRVQSLSDKDDWLGHRPDPRVSADPTDPHFSLSFAGEAFFVVGMHPNASRPARRFERPALVFNLHDQFEQLRKTGIYERMRGAIMTRDVALAGDTNPMLARHGTISEARQYSGRAVGPEWGCPLRARMENRHDH